MSDMQFPYFNFYFEIELSKGGIIRAHEVSGFGVKYTVKDAEHRDALGRRSKSIDKSEYDNITIKKGIYYDDPEEWKNLRKDAFREADPQEHYEKLKIETIYIKLMLADGEMAMAWTMSNAFPINWKVTDFNANEAGIAVETIEFVFDQLNLSVER